MQHWFLHRAAKGGTCASGGGRSEHIYVWVRSLSLSPSLSQPLSLSLLRLQSLLALYKAMHVRADPAGFHARAEDRCMSSACAVCIRMP